MKKKEMIDLLSEYTMTEITMECEKCKTIIGNYMGDEIDLAKEAYKKGWRFKDEKCVCPKCTKRTITVTKII